MVDEDGSERIELLGRDYWLITSTPLPETTAADIEAHVAAHLSWALALEDRGLLFLSGPVVDGPGARPGSGITVLRAADADEARSIAQQDPFVVAGLRTFVVHCWRLNEGSVSVRMRLGRSQLDWD